MPSRFKSRLSVWSIQRMMLSLAAGKVKKVLWAIDSLLQPLSTALENTSYDR